MASSARVRLLEADPDLGALLTAEEFAEARQVAVPVVTVERGDLTQFHQADVFGALVLNGMVLRQLQVVDQMGMRLLGPGDIIQLKHPAPPMLVVQSAQEALPETRLALLGREAIFAVRRWPPLLAGLQLRVAQQADRLAAQLVICQLPRVDQRLLSLLWLLAESWGRVTPTGTALPLKLTHEALGALIGARRPTVTLALRDLTERGALIRQQEGWLLLEPAPRPSERAERARLPTVIESSPPDWAEKPDVHAAGAAAAAAEAAANSAALAVLRDSVERLRRQHEQNRTHFEQRLRDSATARERFRASRTRIASERLSRRARRFPSS